MAGPEVIAALGFIATAATTATTITQSQQARKDQRRAAGRERSIEMEARRKDQLLSSQQERLRQRRAAGSGQTTILGGSATSQAEIQRNVLLGQ